MTLGDTEQIEHLAKKTNLVVKETAMWLKHLDGIRKRRVQGAKKAAATRVANNGKYPIKHPNIVVIPVYGSCINYQVTMLNCFLFFI